MSNLLLLRPGARVMIDVSWLDAIPLRSQIHGRTARVLRYSTPEIQVKQVWTDETYAVQIEGETVERMLNRKSLVELP